MAKIINLKTLMKNIYFEMPPINYRNSTKKKANKKKTQFLIKSTLPSQWSYLYLIFHGEYDYAKCLTIFFQSCSRDLKRFWPYIWGVYQNVMDHATRLFGIFLFFCFFKPKKPAFFENIICVFTCVQDLNIHILRNQNQ